MLSSESVRYLSSMTEVSCICSSFLAVRQRAASFDVAQAWPVHTCHPTASSSGRSAEWSPCL
jgi:hypothetical protein